jgi:type IV pilus assembly protein PilC
MKFRYTARIKDGTTQTGFVEGANREAALNILVGHELFVLTIEPVVERDRWYDRVLSYFRRVKPADLMVFTRQFSTLLGAQVSLADSLRAAYRQTRNVNLKEALGEVSADIDSGLSLSQAFERQGAIFSEFYVNMIRSAEITGRVNEVTNYLADYQEKEYGLRNRVRNAMIYPVFVIGLFVIVAGILIAFVLPALAPIFTDSGVELPFFTQILFNAGDFLAEWWWAVIIAAGVLAFMVMDYLRTEEGAEMLDYLGTEMPVIGNLFKKMYIARFAEAVSVLLKGGIPVAQALEISGRTVGSATYREILHEVAERVKGGELLSSALATNEAYMPSLVSQMVSIGENTGKLDEMFDRVSSFYTREVDGLVGNLVELIQPALMVGIGVAVGGLFAAILIPVYNLAGAF